MINLSAESIRAIITLAFIFASWIGMAQNTLTKSFDKADERLADLMIFGLDHGIESVMASVTGPLIPFVVTDSKGERTIKRLMTDRLEDGLENGLTLLRTDQTCDYGIVVYDGYLTVGGEKYDAVIVRGFDRKDKLGYMIGQRYQLESSTEPFKKVGNPIFVGNDEQLLK
ncbi:MAG: hypothetical protein RIE86_20300 [Imperialibacter sp.]|uniref:hypothetical protein n=1 Tax=Imperialibacter sp. TaxID=2038411 RepID=UPI0032EB9365